MRATLTQVVHWAMELTGRIDQPGEYHVNGKVMTGKTDQQIYY